MKFLEYKNYYQYYLYELIGSDQGCSQLQFIVPQKAQLIFDVNQAYQAYFLQKIQIDNNYQNYQIFLRNQQSNLMKFKNNQNERMIIKLLRNGMQNYQEDILKRLASNKQLKAQQNTDLLDNLRSMSKFPPKRKTRKYKTKFQIVKKVKKIIQQWNKQCDQISIQTQVPGCANNQDYDACAPFLIPTLEFAEQLNEEKQTFKQKVINENYEKEIWIR